MTQVEIYEMLESTGLPVAYYEFKTAQTPPYLVYLFAYSNDFIADNHNYCPVNNFQIELYTEFKDPELEKKIEDKLKENRLPYTKRETFIESEGLFQILYEIQVTE